MHKLTAVVLLITFRSALVLLLTAPCRAAPGWEASPNERAVGQFWRLHWYERGLTNGNPAFDSRFRINAPEVVLHPSFGRRIEARENGLMLIHAEEDLFQISAAELYLEMWGGHPGTANKRFTINGRTTYFLPRVGTEDNNCTYFYPSVPLKITDLVNGYDAFQFALDQGTTFWGHALIDNACLRVALTNQHPDLIAAGLSQFEASVHSQTVGEIDTRELNLVCPEAMLSRVASVDFQGWYQGYDENGNGQTTDWHGFTKAKDLQAHLGTVTNRPFQIRWDTRMLPEQSNVAVRAFVHFTGLSNVVYVTSAEGNLRIGPRPRGFVTIVQAQDLPHPFWSRAGQKRFCTLILDMKPSDIQEAELDVAIWDGGAGTIAKYFTLNGVPTPVASRGHHDVLFSKQPVDPGILRQGRNEIEVLSDTEHHGLEILAPGPALVVRSR